MLAMRQLITRVKITKILEIIGHRTVPNNYNYTHTVCPALETLTGQCETFQSK